MDPAVGAHSRVVMDDEGAAMGDAQPRAEHIDWHSEAKANGHAREDEPDRLAQDTPSDPWVVVREPLGAAQQSLKAQDPMSVLDREPVGAAPTRQTVGLNVTLEEPLEVSSRLDALARRRIHRE